MIDRARELSEAEGLHNVTFEHADAQSFPSESFDIAISRFGTMFFSDPVAAFANIAHALRREGRLLMMVWQAHELNEWSVAITRALAGDGAAPPPAPQGSDPFSLGDPDTLIRMLDAAGFADVNLTDVRRPVYYGPDVSTAIKWVRGFACTNEILRSLERAPTERAFERLRETVAAHARPDGIWFDAQAWIAGARRRLRGSSAEARPSAR
jgi:SAM-dependent methyltransferase